jgi:hypothetical protein
MYRRVREAGMDAFKERLAFSWERPVQQRRFAGTPELDLRVPELDELWQYLASSPRLSEMASVGQGFSFKGQDLPSGTLTLSPTRRPGFKPCFVSSRGDPPIYGTPDRRWMNPAKAVIQRPRAGLNGRPGQVIVNHARTSRGPWTMKAWLDEEGCAVKGNFLVVHPTSSEMPAIVLWALLNSPIANGFIYSRATKRHIIGGDLLKLPLPTRGKERIRDIATAAGEYLTTAQQLQRALIDDDTRAAVRRALLELDATVLNAYDLPPSLERQLLELFTDVERKGVGLDGPEGRSTFRGYYPPGFTSALPLHVMISERFERAAADQSAQRFKPGESAYVRDVLNTVAASFGESSDRAARYARASALLDEWASEDPEFDNRVDPLIEDALRESDSPHAPEP